MTMPAYTAEALIWLIDYQDCLDGIEGAEWETAAENFVERDLPTDGTSWMQWRDLRWSSK